MDTFFSQEILLGMLIFSVAVWIGGKPLRHETCGDVIITGNIAIGGIDGTVASFYNKIAMKQKSDL